MLLGAFQGVLKNNRMFQGFLEDFRYVTETFRRFRRVLDTLHGVRRGFGAISGACQGVSEDYTFPRRYRGMHRRFACFGGFHVSYKGSPDVIEALHVRF